MIPIIVGPARKPALTHNPAGVIVNMMKGILDPRIDFTRATAAWMFNSSGLLEQAALDQPRFDYGTPGSGQLQGLLLEGGQTNQCLQSRDLTQAAWTKTSATAAKNQTGLDGAANSASSLTASAINATCLQTVTDASSVARTFSIYVKRLVGVGGIDITIDGGTTWVPVTVTAAWTRVFVTQTLANPNFGIRIQASGDSIAVDCCQEEAFGAPTSPIITTSASVLRAQDLAVLDGVDFTEWYTAAGGTLLAEWIMSTPQVSGVERCVVSIDDNTANERITILANNGSAISRATITDGGVVQAALLGAAVSLDTVHKAAIAFAANDAAAAMDNAAPNTDAALTLPTVTQMRLGGRFNSTTSQLYGHLRRVSFWRRRLTNAQVQGITA